MSERLGKSEYIEVSEVLGNHVGRPQEQRVSSEFQLETHSSTRNEVIGPRPKEHSHQHTRIFDAADVPGGPEPNVLEGLDETSMRWIRAKFTRRNRGFEGQPVFVVREDLKLGEELVCRLTVEWRPLEAKKNEGPLYGDARAGWGTCEPLVDRLRRYRPGQSQLENAAALFEHIERSALERVGAETKSKAGEQRFPHERSVAEVPTSRAPCKVAHDL